MLRRLVVSRCLDGAPVALADAIGADLCAGVASCGGELLCALIVGVEHGDARSRIDGAVEEQALGGEVFFHRLVIVEMVAGEVGEDSHVEVDAGGAALVEARGWKLQ
jgi:hypothetical protein